ncbi:hypothetical protein F441_02672 [Phytophthora nicotianae CJ01A1]|uniref:Uncharacterized protein n=3 Tax=Phytophthora nicotianae TaxID=4792 RepID=V9FUM4_PHYNI|nr:hypothetical protein F443_02710 [Phytophthora nicotianae P1569]ETP24286.1 hypothetical protein F441_02672 [Phytophthora nicotianae CJ01A1]ETP52262.1 hypothetical protein F442_02675 [Phytophthora nicotianae P10297]
MAKSGAERQMHAVVFRILRRELHVLFRLEARLRDAVANRMAHLVRRFAQCCLSFKCHAGDVMPAVLASTSSSSSACTASNMRSPCGSVVLHNLCI